MGAQAFCIPLAGKNPCSCYQRLDFGALTMHWNGSVALKRRAAQQSAKHGDWGSFITARDGHVFCCTGWGAVIRMRPTLAELTSSEMNPNGELCIRMTTECGQSKRYLLGSVLHAQPFLFRVACVSRSMPHPTECACACASITSWHHPPPRPLLH